MRWKEKRYNSLDYYLKNRFGEKVYKVSLDGGFSCPNRDGTKGVEGCIFCSGKGSGEFTSSRHLSISEQIVQQKKLYINKHPNGKFIAYFQNFSGTYASNDYLNTIYNEAISQPDIVGLSIATRPDCITPENIEILREYNKKTELWIELGLQTANDKTGDFINRGYDLDEFERAIALLKENNIKTIIHLIIGLPGENREVFLNTINYVAKLDIFGIKFHMLLILKNSKLEQYFEENSYEILDKEDYVEYICTAISMLNPNIVIHRLVSDTKKDMLIKPKWVLDKRRVLNAINSKLRKNDNWQGEKYT